MGFLSKFLKGKNREKDKGKAKKRGDTHSRSSSNSGGDGGKRAAYADPQESPSPNSSSGEVDSPAAGGASASTSPGGSANAQKGSPRLNFAIEEVSVGEITQLFNVFYKILSGCAEGATKCASLRKTKSLCVLLVEPETPLTAKDFKDQFAPSYCIQPLLEVIIAEPAPLRARHALALYRFCVELEQELEEEEFRGTGFLDTLRYGAMLEEEQNNAQTAAANAAAALARCEDLDLVKIYTNLLRGGNYLPTAEEMNEIIIRMAAMLRALPNVVPVMTPVVVVGDIHGQINDVLTHVLPAGGPLVPAEALQAFQTARKAKKAAEKGSASSTTAAAAAAAPAPPATKPTAAKKPANNYLFLGDYVDRGSRSLQCMCLLFVAKLLSPQTVTLLRGNHECRLTNRHYGFLAECHTFYPLRRGRITTSPHITPAVLDLKEVEAEAKAAAAKATTDAAGKKGTDSPATSTATSTSLTAVAAKDRKKPAVGAPLASAAKKKPAASSKAKATGGASSSPTGSTPSNNNSFGSNGSGGGKGKKTSTAGGETDSTGASKKKDEEEPTGKGSDPAREEEEEEREEELDEDEEDMVSPGLDSMGWDLCDHPFWLAANDAFECLPLCAGICEVRDAPPDAADAESKEGKRQSDRKENQDKKKQREKAETEQAGEAEGEARNTKKTKPATSAADQQQKSRQQVILRAAAMHGGLSPYIENSFDGIIAINRFREIENGALADLTWSDPLTNPRAGPTGKLFQQSPSKPIAVPLTPSGPAGSTPPGKLLSTLLPTRDDDVSECGNVTSILSVTENNHIVSTDDFDFTAPIVYDDVPIGYTFSARGTGHNFGEDVTCRFLNTNGLRFVVRAHQCVHEGYQWVHQHRLLTVFSAPNYCGMGNKGSVLLLDEQCAPSIVQYEYDAAAEEEMLARDGADRAPPVPPRDFA